MLDDSLGLAIEKLVLGDDLPNDPSTWDKKIEMMKVSNELYRMIYGDNLMFYHIRLSFNFWIISTYLIAQGKTEETLDALENMCRHAAAYDQSYISDHGKHYSSIFTDKLIYPEPGKDFHEPTEHSNSYYMLARLEHKRYECIRENERYLAVVTALKRFAK